MPSGPTGNCYSDTQAPRHIRRRGKTPGCMCQVVPGATLMPSDVQLRGFPSPPLSPAASPPADQSLTLLVLSSRNSHHPSGEIKPSRRCCSGRNYRKPSLSSKLITERQIILCAAPNTPEQITFRKTSTGDFPGGPVATTLRSKHKGPKFSLWSGN